MNIVKEDWLARQPNVRRFDEFKEINGKRYQRVEYSYVMGYQSQLRNLRNLAESGASAETIADVSKYIADPVNVSKSRQLPFDFVEAYNVIKPINSKLATAVSKAIDESVGNLPEIGKKLWIVIDYSGSMGQDGSPAITNSTLMAASLLKAHGDAVNTAVTLFGSRALTLKGVDVNNSVLSIQKELLTHRRGGIGGSTNFRTAMAEITKLGFKPDTIVVFTDGEINMFPYGEFKQLTTGNAVKIVVNMHAAPSTPMSSKDGWYALAGWSSAMFKFIPAVRDKKQVVDVLLEPYAQ